jgi:magnesium chelatase subunit I
VIGQEEMKLALLLNVIDPRIGGVMIMGDRGTGKSTTIRALADLLPDIDVVAGDPYNSSATDPDLQSSEVRERLIRDETCCHRATAGADGGPAPRRHRRPTLRNN